MVPETPRQTVGGAGAALWSRASVLCLVVALCYANSLDVPFLFDDRFLEQPDVRLDYSTRPLVWASFDLNRALGGRETWGFHVFNALVHLLTAFLLLGVVRRAMGHVAPGLARRTGDDLAFVTTLLWLCHPLQTEAVTYLSQRAESMGALFYLLVLYAFLRSAPAARPRAWQALACLALALGFATKEIIATAPLVVWLYDALFLAKGPLTALRLRPGFYGAMVLVVLALSMVFVAPLLVAEHSSAGLRLGAFGPLEYARTQPGVLLHYLRLAFWPHPLCLDYGWPIAEEPRDYLPQTAVVATLLVASAVLCLRRSWIGFAGACFFLILAPTSSFVPIRDPAVEHRVYLPLAAVLLLVVAGSWWLFTRFLPGARRVLPVLATAATLSLAAATIRRNEDYRSAVRIMQVTVERAPLNPRPHANLGSALLDAGRTEEAIVELLEALSLDMRDGYVSLSVTPGAYIRLATGYLRLQQPDRALPFLKRAVELNDDARILDDLGYGLFQLGEYQSAALGFEKALVSAPNAAGIHHRLAATLERLQRPEEAARHYREALRLEPGLQDAHLGLAELLAADGQPEEALGHYSKALEIPPNSAEEHFNLGLSLRALGRFDQAMTAFLEASRIAPELPEPYAAFAQTVCMKPDARPDELQEAVRLARKADEMTGSTRPEMVAILDRAEALVALLGQSLFDKGDAAGAVRHLQGALEADPNDAGLHYRLACALGELQRSDEALQHYLEALRLDPQYHQAHVKLAALLARQGRASEALQHARKALEVSPDSTGAHFNLGQALRALGRFDEAMAAFLEASRLAPEQPEPLAAFARTVCLKPDASRQEREEALRLAQKANEMTDSTRPDILEIFAMAHAALGDFERAAALVEEALKLPGPTGNPVFARRLGALRDEYLRKAGQ